MNYLFFTDVENSSLGSNQTSQSTNTFSWDGIFENITNWLLTTGIEIVIGLFALFVLFKIINGFTKSLKRKMELRQCDKTVTALTYSIIRTGLKVLFVILFVSYIGIDTAAIGSIVSSIGIGFSLAVQGSLSNFAGGIVIVVMKPFGIGDYIVAQDCSGTVEKIKLFYTYLVTSDNRVQMIPNGDLANGVITNNSAKDTRRVDLTFSISYDSSVDDAIKIIKETELKNPLIFHTPAPFVGISEFADSSINLSTKVWVKNGDYWTVVYELNNAINKALVEGGIAIPYPQLDVHISQSK